MTATLNIFASESVRTTASQRRCARLVAAVLHTRGRLPRRRCRRGRRFRTLARRRRSGPPDGAAGVIVVQPGPEDLGGLRALAADHGVVVIDSTWASNPVLAAASQALHAAIGPHSRLECRIVVRVGTDLDRALLDQLSLLRALVGPVTDLEILHRV